MRKVLVALIGYVTIAMTACSPATEYDVIIRNGTLYDGMYISHLRSEGNQLLEGVDELITIAREAEIRAEIYHLKAAGRANWSKLENVFERVEAARAEGLSISANIYTYVAGATGLNAAMPPWVQEGGYDAWAERLKNLVIRRRLKREMSTPTYD